MSIIVETTTDMVKINIDGDFNVDKADDFRGEIKSLMDSGKKRFLIDFSKCNFIDSTGLGVLLSTYKKLNEINGELKICSLHNPNVMKVFTLTRLDKVFNIYASAQEAMN